MDFYPRSNGELILITRLFCLIDTSRVWRIFWYSNKKLTLTFYARFHYNLIGILNLDTEIIALHFTYLEEKDTWQLYQSAQTKYMWHLSGSKTIGNPIKCCTEVVPRRNLCFLSISEIWLPKDSSRGSAQLTLWIPILKFCRQCQRKVLIFFKLSIYIVNI